MELYILDNDNHPVPVRWGEYEEWHDRLPAGDKCQLGKRLKQDSVGPFTVSTLFMGSPIGFFGRKPQLWLTLTLGPDRYAEQVYSSHRASLQGHARTVRELKRKEVSNLAIA